MSGVTCHLFFFFLQIGEARRWRVCYQRGRPRLVFSGYIECIVCIAYLGMHFESRVFCVFIMRNLMCIVYLVGIMYRQCIGHLVFPMYLVCIEYMLYNMFTLQFSVFEK